MRHLLHRFATIFQFELLTILTCVIIMWGRSQPPRQCSGKKWEVLKALSNYASDSKLVLTVSWNCLSWLEPKSSSWDSCAELKATRFSDQKWPAFIGPSCGIASSLAKELLNKQLEDYHNVIWKELPG